MVADQHREACLDAINRFHELHGQAPMVICCRSREYDALRRRLRLRGAAEIVPLARRDVESYLARGGEALRAVRELMARDKRSWQLLATPLALRLLHDAWRRDPRRRRSIGPMEVGELVDDHIEAALRRGSRAAHQPYTPEEVLRWLAWLGASMVARGQSIFYVDWIQPEWLPTPGLRRLATIGVAAAVGLAGGLLTATVVGAAAALLLVPLGAARPSARRPG